MMLFLYAFIYNQLFYPNLLGLWEIYSDNEFSANLQHTCVSDVNFRINEVQIDEGWLYTVLDPTGVPVTGGPPI